MMTRATSTRSTIGCGWAALSPPANNHSTTSTAVRLKRSKDFPSRYDVNMLLEVLTAAAAVVAAITGLWNTVQIGRLSGRLDTLTTQVNSHVNAPGLHTH